MRTARRAMYSILLMIAVMWPASAASAAGCTRDSWFNRTETEHNISTSAVTSRPSRSRSTGHAISTETAQGSHFTFVDHGVYTVDFDDPALGIWTARFTETFTFNATPGDVITAAHRKQQHRRRRENPRTGDLGHWSRRRGSGRPNRDRSRRLLAPPDAEDPKGTTAPTEPSWPPARSTAFH